MEKSNWINFSEKLPPKDQHILVQTFGLVTIGERTSDADRALRLSILDPISNSYKNIDPSMYQIRRWQPLPPAYREY